MVCLVLAVWELIFGHDLLFQPARVALVAITVVGILTLITVENVCISLFNHGSESKLLEKLK